MLLLSSSRDAVKISGFAEFMTSIGAQSYLFFYLTVEVIKGSLYISWFKYSIFYFILLYQMFEMLVMLVALNARVEGCQLSPML